jgi:hypothetical protein
VGRNTPALLVRDCPSQYECRKEMLVNHRCPHTYRSTEDMQFDMNKLAEAGGHFGGLIYQVEQIR